jgi:RNA polymerase sigma-70 factor (ECF subfamily)
VWRVTFCRATESGAAVTTVEDGGDAGDGDDAVLGRSRAFCDHVEPQIDVLLRVARTLTNSWAEAEDLTQECLIRAWSAADRFDGAHPRAWLLTILRRTHLNMCRRTRPMTVGDLTLLPRARPAFDAALPVTPEDSLLAGVLPDDLERAVAGLDERFRTVLELVDLDGLSCPEAARALGLPVGTVVSRLSRARARVRARLDADGVRAGGARVAGGQDRRP